jgi:hypothetical protein
LFSLGRPRPNPPPLHFRHLISLRITLTINGRKLYAMKNWKIDRIISVTTLVVAVIALILVLKKPAPIATPQTVAQATANAQSFQNKLSQLEQAQPTQSQNDSDIGAAQSDPQQSNATTQTPASAQPSEVHMTSDEVSAAIAQASGALTSQLSSDSDIGSMPAIKDQQVSFDGDLVHGQFLTNIAGKDVWVTVSGHLGEKDGYATFDPTEFKIGDLNIPVSLVNGPLQKKLAEQHDRLKLPDSVGGVKVQDGELVLQQK